MTYWLHPASAFNILARASSTTWNSPRVIRQNLLRTNRGKEFILSVVFSSNRVLPFACVINITDNPPHGVKIRKRINMREEPAPFLTGCTNGAVKLVRAITDVSSSSFRAIRQRGGERTAPPGRDINFARAVATASEFRISSTPEERDSPRYCRGFTSSHRCNSGSF